MYDDIVKILLNNGFIFEKQFQKICGNHSLILINNNKFHITFDVMSNKKYKLLYFSQLEKYVPFIRKSEDALLVLNDNIVMNQIVKGIIILDDRFLFLSSSLKIITDTECYQKYGAILCDGRTIEIEKKRKDFYINTRISHSLISIVLVDSLSKNRIRELYQIDDDIRFSSFRDDIKLLLLLLLSMSSSFSFVSNTY